MNTSKIEKLDTYLFFLDDEARAIETAALSRALPFVPEVGLTLSKELKVPAGAEAIAFGYFGEAGRNGGGGSDHAGGSGGGMEDFYDLPKRVKS